MGGKGKNRFRVLKGINYPTDPEILRRLRAGENIPWPDRQMRRAEPGDVVDDLPTASVPWLLEDGAIEPAGEVE